MLKESLPEETFFLLLVFICYRLSKPQDLVQLKGLGKLKNVIHLMSLSLLNNHTSIFQFTYMAIKLLTLDIENVLKNLHK
jgi:hypothetical protein